MGKLTVSDLHGYLLDERSLGSLGEIPPNLYEEITGEMSRICQEVTSLSDPFSEGVQSLIREKESLREFLRDLYSLRMRKIVSLALAASNDEEIDRNQLRMMVSGERVLYDVVYESCASCRKALLDGKQTIEITAYKYAALESAEDMTASPISAEIPEVLDEIAPESDACRAETAPDQNRVVAIQSPISEFQDLSGRIYTLSPGDVVSLPQQMAEILCNDNKALSIRIR